MAVPEVVSRAVAAAQAGDAATVRSLIDWPLTGAAVMFRSLGLVDEADRAVSVALGLAELDGATGDADMVANVLAEEAEFLVPAEDVETATDGERADVLRALQVPELPPGLTAAQLARADELRARAAQLREVYVVVGPNGRRPYAIASDTGLLVLLLG
jgi:hypothetical protein